jgi:hypothetical protein
MTRGAQGSDPARPRGGTGVAMSRGMPRLRLASLAPLAILAIAGPAAAESAPPPADRCDLQSLPLGVPETVPSGCVVTVYDYAGDLPGLGWREPVLPTVTAHSPGGDPILAPVAIARSPVRLPIDRYEWCDDSTCTNQSWGGDLDGVRFDIVLLAPLPAGTVVDVRSDVGPAHSLLLGEPAACPPPDLPLVECVLAACEGSCEPRVPCDGGIGPVPTRDAGPGVDAGDPWIPPCGSCVLDEHPGGCSAGGPAAPSVLLALGLAFVIRRWRRRAGSPARS